MGRHMHRFVRVRPGTAYRLRRTLHGWVWGSETKAYLFKRCANGWTWQERWRGDPHYAFTLRQAVSMADKDQRGDVA